jgi:hypothetical protein
MIPISKKLCEQSFYCRDASSLGSLRSVIDHVNAIISIVRHPSDPNTVKSSNIYIVFSHREVDELTKHSIEATSSLMDIPRCFSESRSEHSIKSEDSSIYGVSSQDSVQSELPAGWISTQGLTEIEPAIDASFLELGNFFENLQDAEDAFRGYGLECGFNICRGNSKKDVYQEYACSAKGSARKRKVDELSRQRNRTSMKHHCKCHIVLRKKEGLWFITSRKLSHTHALMTPDEIRRSAKNRHIPHEFKQEAISLYSSGKPPSYIQQMFESKLGSRCTWNMKDLYNLLYKYKKSSD